MPVRQTKAEKVTFRLSAADRKALEAGARKLGVFTEYFFDWTPYPWQEYFYHSPQRNKIVIAGIRTGKMERLSSPILTTDGWKQFGELEVGDYVFGADGKPTRVTMVHPIRYDQRCYEVVFSDGSVVPCGGDHLWTTHNFSYRKALARRVQGPRSDWDKDRPQCRPHLQPRTLTTEEIRATLKYRHQTNHAVPLAAPLQYPERELPIDPYLFGVWLGDGTSAAAEITSADQEILDAFLAAGFTLRQTGLYRYAIGASDDVPGDRNRLRRLLHNLGVLGAKRIPEAYLRSSVQQRLALLQGLMDTDGTVDYRTGACSFCQTNKELLGDVKELIAGLGMQYRESSRIPKIGARKCNRSYCLSFTPTTAVFRLERKRKLQKLDRSVPNRAYRYIVDVRAIPSEPMRCITVEADDHLYLTGKNLIPTHNSVVTAAGMMHYATYHPGARLANACISSDQAAIVFQDCLNFAKKPRFEKFIADTQQHPFPKITFINGAEIWFRSIGYEAELWRGWEFDWINVDEAGYVQRELAIQTLRGRLLGVGRAGLFTITSTPKGKGWLYELYRKGIPDSPTYDPAHHLSLRVTTLENTKLNKEVLRELFRDYSRRMIQQELEGKFLDSEDAVFRHDELMALCDPADPQVQLLANVLAAERQKQEQERIFTFDTSDLTHYELEPERGHTYLCSWDLGKKPKQSGRNATVGLVWDITRRPFVQVAYRYAPGTPITQRMNMVAEWHEKYRNQDRSQVHTNLDATGKGDADHELLEEERRIPVDGIVYTSTSKPQMIHAAQITVERGWVRMPFIRRFVDQMEGYDLDDQTIAQDIVMAFAQASWQARLLYDGDHGPRSAYKPIAATLRRGMEDDPSMERFIERRQQARSGRVRALRSSPGRRHSA